jgi:hypothetical protein
MGYDDHYGMETPSGVVERPTQDTQGGVFLSAELAPIIR